MQVSEVLRHATVTSALVPGRPTTSVSNHCEPFDSRYLTNLSGVSGVMRRLLAMLEAIAMSVAAPLSARGTTYSKVASVAEELATDAPR